MLDHAGNRSNVFDMEEFTKNFTLPVVINTS